MSERNKQAVLDFYETGLNQKDFHAPAKLLGDTYTQHNPRIADGIAGFEEFIATIRRDFPDLKADVKHLFADGDYVIAHVHGVRMPGQAGTAVVDIFRLDEDGRIVEHWDVIDPVLAEQPHTNGVF